MTVASDTYIPKNNDLKHVDLVFNRLLNYDYIMNYSFLLIIELAGPMMIVFVLLEFSIFVSINILIYLFLFN